MPILFNSEAKREKRRKYLHYKQLNWSISDSNRPPIDCEPIALPDELIPRICFTVYSIFGFMASTRIDTSLKKAMHYRLPCNADFLRIIGLQTRLPFVINAGVGSRTERIVKHRIVAVFFYIERRIDQGAVIR